MSQTILTPTSTSTSSRVSRARQSKEERSDDDDEKYMLKTSMRLPKPLMKKLKQYALDNETNVTRLFIQALEDFLKDKGR